MLRELTDVIARQLLITFIQLQELEDVPGNWSN